MSILIQNVEKQCAQFAKSFLLLKETRIARILLGWKTKLDHEWDEFEKNPAGYLEPAFYSQLRLQSKIAVAPFRLELVSSSSNHHDGADHQYRPRVEPRTGLGLVLAIGIQALLMSRNLLFVAMAFTTEELVVFKKGNFTRDGLFYSVIIQVFALSLVLAVHGVAYRKEIAHTCNSFTLFSETYARKYFAKRTILSMQGRDKVVCFYLASYHAALIVPLFVAGIFSFPDAPVFLPHYFNVNDVNSGSGQWMFKVALLLVDWAWLVTGILQNTFTLCVLSMPFFGLKLALRSLRTREPIGHGPRQDKRKLHVQLELLGRLLDNLIRHLTPLLSLITLLIPVFCNVAIATTLLDSSKIGDRYLLALISLINWSIGGTLSGIGALRLAGSVREESLQVLLAIRQESLADESGPDGNNLFFGRGKSKAAVARIFASRRELQLYMGHFRVLGGPGDDAAFVLSILENTVNLVFMVDPNSKIYLVGGNPDSG